MQLKLAYLILIIIALFVLLKTILNIIQKARYKKLSLRDKIIYKLSNNRNELINFYNLEKGIAYEFFVGEYYENLGYKVTFNGIEKGINDGGIDLIASKKIPINEKQFKTQMLLFQCKNYNNPNELNQDIVRKFLGDCYVYLHSKNLLHNKNFTFTHIFCTSNELDDDNNIIKYERFCQNHRSFDLQIKTIPYNEKNINSNERLQNILKIQVYSNYSHLVWFHPN